jgi:hypothetical protein
MIYQGGSVNFAQCPDAAERLFDSASYRGNRARIFTSPMINQLVQSHTQPTQLFSWSLPARPLRKLIYSIDDLRSAPATHTPTQPLFPPPAVTAFAGNKKAVKVTALCKLELTKRARRRYVFIIFRPAGRLLIGPLPPGDFAARVLAAVIRPPLVFLAMFLSGLFRR